MSKKFFEKPILNSPYLRPDRHWELDHDGQPTTRIKSSRRKSELIVPIPKPKSRRNQELGFAESIFDELDEIQQSDNLDYNVTHINMIRTHVETWRNIKNSNEWQVTPTTAKLLQHWRNHAFQDIRPFFCQVEAIETIIWLLEVAPHHQLDGKRLLKHLATVNKSVNQDLYRLALKLCTGSGKTTVMAMMIAWQTINYFRSNNSKTRFTNGFLVVTPGITIKDRLRVLLPNDPDNYYKNRELVPADMLQNLLKAKVVITNYHAFQLRNSTKMKKMTRKFIEGRNGSLATTESEGEMIRRVIPNLEGINNIMVINDEAHHCYSARQILNENEMKGDERKEAEDNREKAKLWMGGLNAIRRKQGIGLVADLSATPFFLKGSGYREGTLFPWTVSDFSLMDGIECGIVKLPRVPVADNVSGGETPKLRNLWKYVGKKLPQKGRRAEKILDPLKLPIELLVALDALYSHYEKTFNRWKEAGIAEHPIFIVVCNNTATSKLVYDYISGFSRNKANGTIEHEHGRLKLFRNHDEQGIRLVRPKTLLIDSAQIESGDSLDGEFRNVAADEIEQFRNEVIQRSEGIVNTDHFTDAELLREIMNTVGRKGKLGETIRCVVSVSMLSEGWDVNAVTHILGVRAFGTQLLCEQVVGRALRRLSYDIDENGLLGVEYADVLGIPFDFTAEPVAVVPQVPRERVQVHAISPERDWLEIQFPRVQGYRLKLPDESFTAKFGKDSVFILSPDIIGPSITTNRGIIGKGTNLRADSLKFVRRNTILYHLTKYLIYRHFREEGEAPKVHLFDQLKRVCRRWMDEGYLQCKGGTYEGQLMYMEMADIACERIMLGINNSNTDNGRIVAELDPYSPIGTTGKVNFATTKKLLWKTKEDKSHVNWVVCDSEWEQNISRSLEMHPMVKSYAKNQGLGLEVPYRYGGQKHVYLPDFILQLHNNALMYSNAIIEVKGKRDERDKVKAETMHKYWIPGVNNLKKHGKWLFAEVTDGHSFDDRLNEIFEIVVDTATSG